jgi:hypothetical protein
MVRFSEGLLEHLKEMLKLPAVMGLRGFSVFLREEPTPMGVGQGKPSCL